MPVEIFRSGSKLAVLIDPDHKADAQVEILLEHLALGLADVILVGGSTSRVSDIDDLIQRIKAHSSKPVILFPGNAIQLSNHADGLLLPSLISGRNSDYLIGKHVESARIIKSYDLEVIPMGYILVEGGKVSTTSYVTQTMPIPQSSPELAADTALAGQLLGMKCIYLEAGSGAQDPINTSLIKSVRKQIDIPLIVGGGIRNVDQLLSARSAGADMVVVGSILEEDPAQLIAFHKAWSNHVYSN